MKNRIGISADDITGADDIGLMFAKNGFKVGIFPLSKTEYIDSKDELDVVVIDTDSRFDEKGKAALKVHKAAHKLMELNCDMYYKKTCSVFRGNIGAEFDAMQDEIKQKCSMVVLGFPKNGRTTVNGIHYVYGRLLENSQFRNDPVNPMRISSLKKIMQKQTSRKIDNITYHDLDSGYDFAFKRMLSLKEKASYIIFDVRDQNDLKLISRIIKDERNICGSSAICEELAAAYNSGCKEMHSFYRTVHEIKDDCGVLIAAGSLTEQTRNQVEYMKATGCTVIEFHTEKAYDENSLTDEIDRIVKKSVGLIGSGNDVLVYTSNTPESIQDTKRIGYIMGFDDEHIGRMISSSMNRIVCSIIAGTGCRKIISAGGDTSAALVNGMGIGKMIVLDEIEPGIPSMYGYDQDNEFLLVLKSGSFGSNNFLYKAVQRLKELQKGMI